METLLGILLALLIMFVIMLIVDVNIQRAYTPDITYFKYLQAKLGFHNEYNPREDQ